jgi:hypothetical protein
MFELEQAISDWRLEMYSRGVKCSETLDELENHLREDLDEQVRSGTDIKHAFESARTRLGETNLLRLEFGKIKYAKALLQLKNGLLSLLGMRNYHLITNMNTFTPISKAEPKWATYIKAGTFLAPSLILWSFSCVFLMPKLRQICGNAGFALPTVLQAMIFATSHAVLISIGLVLSFLLLKWRSAGWSKYRRAVIGSGVFLINAFVLLVITMMVFSALIAAPAMAHAAK